MAVHYRLKKKKKNSVTSGQSKRLKQMFEKRKSTKKKGLSLFNTNGLFKMVHSREIHSFILLFNLRYVSKSQTHQKTLYYYDVSGPSQYS